MPEPTKAAPRPLPPRAVDRPPEPMEDAEQTDADEPERCYRDGSLMNECWRADR